MCFIIISQPPCRLQRASKHLTAKTFQHQHCGMHPFNNLCEQTGRSLTIVLWSSTFVLPRCCLGFASVLLQFRTGAMTGRSCRGRAIAISGNCGFKCARTVSRLGCRCCRCLLGLGVNKAPLGLPLGMCLILIVHDFESDKSIHCLRKHLATAEAAGIVPQNRASLLGSKSPPSPHLQSTPKPSTNTHATGSCYLPVYKTQHPPLGRNCGYYYYWPRQCLGVWAWCSRWGTKTARSRYTVLALKVHGPVEVKLRRLLTTIRSHANKNEKGGRASAKLWAAAN